VSPTTSTDATHALAASSTSRIVYAPAVRHLL
jgi:hypothetical protein